MTNNTAMLNSSTLSVCLRWISIASSLLWAFTFASSATWAQVAEPLTWKFTTDDTFNYRLTQQVKMTMKLAGGGNLQTNVNQIIDFSWHVEEVADTGVAVLTLQIKRLELNVEGPGQQGLHFDSSAKERPVGFAAILANPLKSLTSETYRMTLSPRGKFSQIEIPEALLEAFKNAPASKLMVSLATPEAFQAMLQSCWLVLPKKGPLQLDQEWTVTSETANQLLGGTPHRTNTYHYVGPQTVDSQPLEKFTQRAITKFDTTADTDGTTIQIVEQQASGETLFHRSAGRLESSTNKQTMTLRFTTDQQSVEQTLEQMVQCQWIGAR
ncbi:MAG: hypothetical protein ABGX16_06165 [Pirellulales bacterium]